MNEDDHLDRCNDLNLNHLNDKIKTGFQPYIDNQPPFYSLSKNENNDYKIKSSNEYHSNYLDNEIETNDCKLINDELNIKLNNELTNCDNQINMPPPPPPSSLYSDLYGQNLIQNVQCNNQNTAFINASNIANNLNCINDAQIYQSNNTPSSNNTTQSILMNNVSLLNNNTLKIPFEQNHHLNSPIDELNKQQQKIQQQTIYAKINQPLLTNFDQHINEIYQYAASDQLSNMSKSSDSDAAYSTLKLDTASCNSSLISGINNEQQILKCGFPPIYTSPATYLTSLNEQNSNNETTDSGYTFSQNSQNSKQLNNTTAMINLDNNHIQGLKNQLNQYNQQLNSPECLYQSNNNSFVRSRTTIDLNHNASTDHLQTSNSHHQNLNTSVSNYSFFNLHSNQDDLLQYSNKNSYLTYSQANQLPNDITILSPTLVNSNSPIPSSSTKEALIQQQLSNHMNSNCTNLMIMSNNDILGHQQSNLTSATSNNLEDNWYKLISRRLRERYLSKRKIQDSSFDTKKNKLDLDNLDDKKAITTKRTSLNLFYQLFLIKKCSLIPCLLIFACALLIFTLMLFTLLTYYFKSQQNLLNDQLLLSNLHTQLQTNSINNKISNSLNNLSNQQHAATSTNNFAFDIYNKVLIGLTSLFKGISLTSSNTGYQIPNSLTTGDSSTGKHSAQTESQIKFKQYQTINWFKSAIFYEVFVASFQDSNGDGIGDIDGLISRLAYIKELGVTVIRLNSIYSALDYPYQYSNILNHTEIEKQLGTIEDFRRLVHNCHNIGLRIVLDLNPCITSDQHRWAAHFLLNKTDDSHNYYVNTSDYVPINEEGFFQNNFQSKNQLDDTSNLPLNGAFEDLHLNIGGHLFLNYSHPFVQKQLIRTIRFWLNEGIDGFFLTRLHEIQFNQENPEHLIQLLNSLKHQLNLYNKKSKINLDDSDDEEYSEEEHHQNLDKPKKILIASRESLDYLHRRLKRSIIDFWTQETKLNNDVKFRNLYPIVLNSNRLFINNTKLNSSIQSIDPLNSINLDKRTKLTFNQFINNYFQTRIKQKQKKSNLNSDYFNVYSYFDLVDIFLDLKLNGSEQIRDQINEVYLANNLDDELLKDSASVQSSTIVMWSIGDHTKKRLANRLHLNSILVSQFILSMLPGSISLFYGDEIGLRNIQNLNTGKFKNGQLVPMAWSSKGLYANFTHTSNTNDEFISNKVDNLDDSIKPIIMNNNQNTPWLPISIDQLVNRNAEKLQEQIQRIQHLLQFRKQYLSAINFNFYTNENVHHHKPATSAQQLNSLQNNHNNLNYAKSVYQTYQFHYVNNGELVFERYYHNGKTKRRYILFANLSNSSRMNDFSDKFYFGTIKVASNVKRLRDFLYLNSLQLESGEALIAHIE